jgi:membrane-associated phospholipid phosphatase
MSWKIMRLGDLQILLPAMLLASLWLLVTARAWGVVLRWWGFTALAVALTVASKVAFAGWGWGFAPLDYAGISGHAMFSAAVLPVLARCVAGRAGAPWPRVGVGLAYAGAVLVAVALVRTGTHSVAEVLLGFALGGGAAAATLRDWPEANAATVPAWLPVGLAACLLVLPLVKRPTLRPHLWVGDLAVVLSGRVQPYAKDDMRRAFRPQRFKPLSPRGDGAAPPVLPSPRGPRAAG